MRAEAAEDFIPGLLAIFLPSLPFLMPRRIYDADVISRMLHGAFRPISPLYAFMKRATLPPLSAPGDMHTATAARTPRFSLPISPMDAALHGPRSAAGHAQPGRAADGEIRLPSARFRLWASFMVRS